MVRRLVSLLAACGVALGGLTLGAAPASASISGAEISPASWAAGSTATAVVSWDESASSSSNGAYVPGGSGGNYFSIEVGWGWTMADRNPTSTPVVVAATWDSTAQSYTCATSPAITFASPGFGNSGGNIECTIRRSFTSSDNPGQQVVLGNTASSHFTFSGGNAVYVIFESGQVTAPSAGPASDTWRIISLATSAAPSEGQTTTVTTTVPAPTDSSGNPLPLITIDIDGNGGTCQTSKVTGYQGFWALAPGADDCSRYGYTFKEFNTSADGSGLSIAPGGNLHLTNDNRLYAIYETPRLSGPPTDVVAVAGRNQVTVSWQAPADPGTGRTTNYLVTANPSRKVCITSVASANPLSCAFDLPATNTQYTFTAQALNLAGWSEESAASNAVSPFNVVLDSAARTQDRFLGVFKAGSTLSVSGRGPGVAPGTVITPQVRIGSGDWVSETRNLPTVAADRSISWSKRLAKSLNGTRVEVRLTMGDIASDPASLGVGSRFGVPDAPRNVKVAPERGGIRLSWEAPDNDGGSAITSYSVSANVNGLTPSCRVVAGNPLTCVVPLNTSRVAAGTTIPFTVTAVSARGEGAAAKASIRGPLRWVDIRTVGTGGVPGGKTELRLGVEANGFEVGDAFTIELKIGADGPWKRLKGPLVISETAGLSGSGDWSGIIPSEALKQGYTVRVANPKAAPDTWTQKPRP